MSSDFDKKFDEQYYRDKERSAYLPRIVRVDMDVLAAKEVQVEQLKMLHHLDASVMALKETLDGGITASPYGFADWMDSLGGTVSYVRDSIDQLWYEQQKHTRALNRIADALERIAPEQSASNNTGDHDNTDEEYEEFQTAFERND